MVRRTFLLTFLVLSLVAVPLSPTAAQTTDLRAVKTYLLDKAFVLDAAAQALRDAASVYYTTASDAAFDYTSIAGHAQALSTLLDAKAAWVQASPLYEQIEGIVAGVPALAEFDVILDAGTSVADDPEGAVPFDLTLPDGQVLEQPGNLFGLLESTLWGTRQEFVAQPDVDLDVDGAIAFGEVLPDANMLKGTADLFAAYTAELLAAAEAWEPTESDAFTALVVMIPTMSEYFESWKQSRFVAGEESTQAEFVVISRLSDINDILAGLQVVYDSISPRVAALNPAQDEQIRDGLTSLREFVAGIFAEEQAGRLFTAEEADLLGSQAQDQASDLAGQIAQVAAQLGIELAN